MIDTMHSQWVWVKDDLIEVKARLYAFREEGTTRTNIRIDMLAASLGGIQWSSSLNEEAVKEVISHSGVHRFLEAKVLSQEILDAGICLIHTVLHRMVSQKRLYDLVRGSERTLPPAPRLPQGMTRLPGISSTPHIAPEVKSFLSPSSTPVYVPPATGSTLFVPVPEEYILSSSSPEWKVVVLDKDEDGGFIVEHKADSTCNYTVRYTVTAETVIKAAQV